MPPLQRGIAPARRYAADRRAVTALEYALIGSIIIVALIGVVPQLGPWLVGVFADLVSAV